jgi:hypothetical protein
VSITWATCRCSTALSATIARRATAVGWCRASLMKFQK